MNSKRLLLSLALALLVSGLCTWMVGRRMKASATQHTPIARYVSPSHALEPGAVVKREDTDLIEWPGSAPVEGAFSRVEDLLGREVLFPLAKGQPILDRDLSAPGSGTGLASKIPDGMRAVALRSDEIVGVAGFLIPGSHLDVLVTYRPAGAAEPMTATVLENAVVIAAGHQLEPDPQGKISDVTVVTLLLTAEQSQRAVLASNQGSIHFVLRNGGDAGRAASAPALLSQLAAQPVAAAPAAPRTAVRATAAPAPVRHEIETVLAGGSGSGGQ